MLRFKKAEALEKLDEQKNYVCTKYNGCGTKNATGRIAKGTNYLSKFKTRAILPKTPLQKIMTLSIINNLLSSRKRCDPGRHTAIPRGKT